jgi:nucleoid-associated protein YejK
MARKRTIKDKTMSAMHRSKFAALSLVMMTTARNSVAEKLPIWILTNKQTNGVSEELNVHGIRGLTVIRELLLK